MRPHEDSSACGRGTILHLIPVLSGGGAERQLALLASEQAARGMKVHIGLRRTGAEATRLLANEVNIHVLGDHKAASPFLTTRIFKLVRLVQPDVIQTWLPQMDVHGGIVALYKSIPWVISERSSKSAFEGREWWSRPRRWLGLRANAVVANSNGGSEYWKTMPGFRSIVDVVPNSVDVAALQASMQIELPPTFGSRGDVILSVGRLGPEKNLGVVIDAFAAIRQRCDASLVIVGEGPLHIELQAKIDSAGLASRASLLGFQPQWWPWLKRARALVSMSHFEGHPNVLIEAMAGECPLIVSDIPAHRALLDESTAILTPPQDIAALAERMLELLADAPAAVARAKVAFERVQSLTISRAADAYEAIYERLLSEMKI